MNDTHELISAAESLKPEFAAAADEIEAARRVPRPYSDAMAKAGFYRMFVPERIGGMEVAPAIGCRVFETLAQGDASCAWISFIGATSGTTLALIPEDTARLEAEEGVKRGRSNRQFAVERCD